MSRPAGHINWQGYTLEVRRCERHGEEYVPQFGVGCPSCEQEEEREFDYEVWTNPTYSSCSGPEHWAFLYS